ncbi:hypothetical protein KCU99_g403, partial [Aureobasidium melanogenum]
LELGLVCLRDVGEVFLVVGIDFLGVSLASLVSQVVPCQSISKMLHGKKIMMRIPVRCGERELDISPILLGNNALHILKLLNGREEGAPEHMATVLSIANRVKTALFLDLNDVLNGLIFNCRQRVLCSALKGGFLGADIFESFNCNWKRVKTPLRSCECWRSKGMPGNTRVHTFSLSSQGTKLP